MWLEERINFCVCFCMLTGQAIKMVKTIKRTVYAFQWDVITPFFSPNPFNIYLGIIVEIKSPTTLFIV